LKLQALFVDRAQNEGVTFALVDASRDERFKNQDPRRYRNSIIDTQPNKAGCERIDLMMYN
jgi:hypothetical protein